MASSMLSWLPLTPHHSRLLLHCFSLHLADEGAISTAVENIGYDAVKALIAVRKAMESSCLQISAKCAPHPQTVEPLFSLL